jgi:hypothetical protein
MTHGGFSPDFPIRRKGKQKRFFVDNEYYEWGYAKNLSKHATLVYFSLAKHANAKTQACFPGMEKIVREGGICNNRYVSKGLKELERYNLIFVNRPGKRMVNNYYLLDTSVWKKLPGFEKENIYLEPSVKMDKVESQNELATKVEFDPVNHRIKSYDEIEPKKINTEESETNKALSFYKTYYKKEDIKLAINEIRGVGGILGMKEITQKLEQLRHKKKIIPVKEPPDIFSRLFR